MNIAEGIASPRVRAGSRRYAVASPSATNGRAGIRKRGPGVPPPNGSQ